MKLFICCVVTLLSFFAVPAQDKPGDRDRAVEQEVRNLVRTWDEAYVKSDTAALDRLLADEFTFVGGPNKAQYLGSFKGRALQVDSAVSTDMQVQVYGDAVILTGVDTITGKNKGEAVVTKWLYLDVWIKRDGRWQCVKTYSARAPK